MGDILKGAYLEAQNETKNSEMVHKTTNKEKRPVFHGTKRIRENTKNTRNARKQNTELTNENQPNRNRQNNRIFERSIKMKIYAIKDKGQGFSNVFTAVNNYAALRGFSDLVNGEKNLVADHPGDFTLYELGELNQDTGEISPKVSFVEEAQVLKKA